MAQNVNVDTILAGLTAVLEPGSVCEARVLDFVAPIDPRNSGTYTGFYNDWDKLAQDIADKTAHAKGCYVTLHPLKPELLARRANRLEKNGKDSISAGDRDVVRYRWFPIDVDATPIAGVSSTKEEHKKALATAKAVRDFLATQGVPDPLVGDSGNGAHLLIPIDEPVDKDTTALIERALKALAFRFDDDAVHVDTGVSNQSRIWKVYGSVARKGDDTPERPHRIAKLLVVPPTRTLMPRAHLEMLAATLPDDPHVHRARRGHDLEVWAAKHFPDAAGPYSWGKGRKWLLNTCPWDPSHTNRSAFIAQFESGAITAGCLHNSCRDHTWRELRDAVDPDWSQQEQAELIRLDIPYPQPIDDVAFIGLAGGFVRAVETFTEADRNALLLNLLTVLGNWFGRKPQMLVNATRHGTNVSTVIVGKTSRARKGTAYDIIKKLFSLVDPAWYGNCRHSGLSSGEGLISTVQDEVVQKVAVKTKGGPTTYENRVVEEGVVDKRALIVETEFSTPIRVMERQGNTLSTMLRLAFDGDSLRTLVKNSPRRATDPHISILGQITLVEMRAYGRPVDAANGLWNRFLWGMAMRSKLLPRGKAIPSNVFDVVIPELQNVRRFIDAIPPDTFMERDADADALWDEVYVACQDEYPGIVGSILARAEAQILRLSMTYAIADSSTIIRREHIFAAVAVWAYVQDSVMYLFGHQLDNATAQTILTELRSVAPQGLSRTDMHALFDRNKTAEEYSDALTFLERLDLAHKIPVAGPAGRAIEMWYATVQRKEEDSGA
jgi:hypothetical protein